MSSYKMLLIDPVVNEGHNYLVDNSILGVLWFSFVGLFSKEWWVNEIVVLVTIAMSLSFIL